MDPGLFHLFVLIPVVIPSTLHKHAHRKINCLILILLDTLYHAPFHHLLFFPILSLIILIILFSFSVLSAAWVSAWHGARLRREEKETSSQDYYYSLCISLAAASRTFNSSTMACV